MPEPKDAAAVGGGPTMPTGTVTFLFTDLQKSTRLWEEHTEAMRSALARHDAILRDAIATNRGHVFKTMGDAFFAAFANPTDAVEAALAAQKALVAEDWARFLPSASGGTEPEGQEFALSVRIALNTGEAEYRDNDYFGRPLNRLARLLVIGYGGQILLSEATRSLVMNAPPAGAEFRAMGRPRLTDLTYEEVYQVAHPDLPYNDRLRADFANNLPSQVSSFIGREKEIEAVRELLTKSRLVTLTGSGGAGKTRLAIQVGADLLESYPSGVYIAEFAPLSDPNLVPQTVATALGVREEPGRTITQTLADYLKDKTMLLLFDNCEHVLSTSAQLADAILRGCPNVRILASSREGLNIPGETTYRIPSLTLPDPKAPPTRDNILPSESVRLFLERAQSAQPSFDITDQNAGAVSQICVRLDGIPLAIELAAARVRALPVEQIAQRLDDRFRLLTGGSRTALPRQQTLRAMIDWSYDLLSEEEKTLFRRLSVFAGGWTLEAAEKICADPT